MTDRRRRGLSGLLGACCLTLCSLLATVGPTSAATASTKPLLSLGYCEPPGALPALADYVALANGYFAEEGVNVTLDYVSGSGLLLAALLSGQCQVAERPTASILPAINGGQPLTVWGGNTDALDTNIIIRSDIARQKGLTAKSTIADRVAALKGLVIGDAGNGVTSDQLLRYVMNKYGLSYQNDAKVTYFASSAVIYTALVGGTIQAAVIGSPYYESLINTGQFQMLVNATTGEVPIVRGIPQANFFSTPSVLAANRQAIIDFSAGEDKALAFIRDKKNLARVAAIAEQYIQGIAPDVMQNTIHHLILDNLFPATTVPSVTLGAYDRSVGFANAAAVLQGTAGVHNTYRSVIDPSIATAALKKLGKK